MFPFWQIAVCEVTFAILFISLACWLSNVADRRQHRKLVEQANTVELPAVKVSRPYRYYVNEYGSVEITRMPVYVNGSRVSSGSRSFPGSE